MKVFVTGGTGFLGRRLIDRLIHAGHEVTALARRIPDDGPQNVRWVVGDLMKPETYADAGHGSERLYHLAAKITFDPRQRADLLKVNGDGTRILLETAKQWGVERSLIVSSACTLGLSNDPGKILDEDSPFDETLAERNPYMASKLACEHHAREAARNGQTTITVCPTTVYGPGDASLNSGTLIQKIVQGKLLPVPSGGSNVVDVDDVVAGMLAAAERGTSGQRYVLGGQNLTFAEIFETIARVTERRPTFVKVPGFSRPLFGLAAWFLSKITGSRFLTPQIVEDLFAYKYYSSERAMWELAWHPQYRFADSAARAFEYYRQHDLL